MRSLKKLLAVIVAICVLATFTIPAFAADSATYTNADQAQKLYDMGLYAGISTTSFEPDLGSTLTREQGMVILLKMFGQKDAADAMTDADADAALAAFTDASKISSWAKKAVAYAVKNSIVSGITTTTVVPQGTLTGNMFATLILKEAGFTVADSNKAAADLTTKGVTGADTLATKELTRDDLVGIAFGALTVTNAAGKTIIGALVDSGKVTAAAAIAAGVVSASVGISSVTATAADTLVVKLNQAVDTTKAVFTIKNGTATVATAAPVWSADKTTATLVKSYKFSAGDYTVTLSGIDNLDAANASKVVSLKDQTVTTISFIGQDLIQNAAGTNATFNYIVKDQYGNDMTKTTNLGKATSQGTIDLNASTGVGTVTYGFAANTSVTTVVVTLVDSGTGVTATQTFNVAKSANVASIAFGDLVFPSGTTRLTAGSATAATIPLTVTDQYGNLIKNTTTLANAITVVSSDTANVHFTFASDTDGNPVLNVDTATLTSAETVVVTLIVTANGKAYTQNYPIVKAAVADKVILGDAVTTDVIADGDTGIVLPITAIDQFGNTLSASDTAANKAVIDAMVSVSGTVITRPTVVNDPNSANYGKMVFDTDTGTGTAMIVSSSTSGVNTKTITVSDARKATSVDNLASSSVIQGATKEVKFVFRDQYGKVMDPPVNAGMTGEATLSKVSGDTDVVTFDAGNTGYDAVSGNILAVDPISTLATLDVNTNVAKTGSYKVTVNLKDDVTGNVLASASTTINVVKNNVSGLVYSIDAIPTLAGDQDYAAADAYARGVSVSAKDAAGTSFTINPNDIISVTSSDTKVADVDYSDKTAIKVFGQDLPTNYPDDSTKTATITVKLNTLDGIKTITAPVTVNAAAPSTTELRAVAETISANNSGTAWKQDSLPGDCSNKLTYVTTEAIAAAPGTGIPIILVAKDQYGVWTDITNPVVSGVAVYTNSTDLAKVDTFAATATSTLFVGTIADVTNDKDIKVTLVLGDGAVQILVHVD